MVTTASYASVDPIGRALRVPVSVGDDDGPSFGRDDHEGLRRFYAEHGYVVVRDVVPASAGERANSAFDREVKADPRAFYRLSGRPEPHSFTPAGFMLHGLRDVQSLDRRHHPAFREAALEVLTDPALVRIVQAVLGR